MRCRNCGRELLVNKNGVIVHVNKTPVHGYSKFCYDEDEFVAVPGYEPEIVETLLKLYEV